jgi:hypothetical protein
MVKKALLIGINYTSIPSLRLNGCINDIEGMKNMLISNYGYTENDIIMLRDDDIKYRQPTARNIIGLLQSLIQITGRCEEIWVHYSGHGSTIKDTNGDEVSGLDSVIVPVDYQIYGVISDDYIKQIISYSKCKTILLFDSCHSGSICDLPFSFEYNINGNNFSRIQIARDIITNKNIFCISGCKDTQTSEDMYDTEDNRYEGALTDAFLDCLRINEYNVGLLKLYSLICIKLQNDGFSQKPILSSSSNNITNISNVLLKTTQTTTKKTRTMTMTMN